MKDHERRNLIDRRDHDDDQGPPAGWRDRRRHAERRIPQIEEQVLSDEEWTLYFCPPKPSQPTEILEAELGAAIYEQLRTSN